MQNTPSLTPRSSTTFIGQYLQLRSSLWQQITTRLWELSPSSNDNTHFKSLSERQAQSTSYNQGLGDSLKRTLLTYGDYVEKSKTLDSNLTGQTTAMEVKFSLEKANPWLKPLYLAAQVNRGSPGGDIKQAREWLEEAKEHITPGSDLEVYYDNIKAEIDTAYELMLDAWNDSLS